MIVVSNLAQQVVARIGARGTLIVGQNQLIIPPGALREPTMIVGTYRTALSRNLRGGLLVSRADVAHLMLATLDRPETIGQTIGIANGRRHRSTR